MKKKWLIFIFILCLIVGILGGCANEQEKQGTLKQVTLNEVAHSIFYAPMYVAIEEGYFKEEGIELNLVTGFGVVI